jgi:hypothetical protein
MGCYGCAATYQLNPEALQFRARTNAEEARAVIAEGLRSGPDNRGGATVSMGHHGSIVSPVFTERTRVEGNLILYWVIVSTHPRSALVAGGGGVGTVAVLPWALDKCEPLPPHGALPGLVICPHELDLTKVTRIRVTESIENSRDVPGCSVSLQQDIDAGLGVSLPNDKVERFVAAASYFSPTAPIADGLGF